MSALHGRSERLEGIKAWVTTVDTREKKINVRKKDVQGRDIFSYPYPHPQNLHGIM